LNILDKYDITVEKLLWIYEKMVKIRVFEERANKEFLAGNLPGFLHLYAGQEAIGVGVCANLRPEDMITTTHRSHGHSIAKGVDVKKMMAELGGKITGTSKGKGGSMHLFDTKVGMLGANGIVAGGVPMTVGAALYFQYKSMDNVSVTFFSDGAVNQGAFLESLNLASIWKLPVIFVCDNNGFAENTPISYHMSSRNLVDRSKGFNIDSEIVDGTDVLAVYSAAKKAIAQSRLGQGPVLLDCKCFRIYGHFTGDPDKIRTPEEKQSFKIKDPILKFTNAIIDEKIVDKNELETIDKKIDSEVEEAWQFQIDSPTPNVESILDGVYANYERD